MITGKYLVFTSKSNAHRVKTNLGYLKR